VMATFRKPDDANRLDFELLRHTPVSLYFSPDVLAEHVAWLREHDYLVQLFDCSAWASEEDFHTDVSRVLGFPDYYGRNLAAFSDCLCGIDVPGNGGAVLVFHSFDRFFRVSPECCWHILDIIALWSRFFLLYGRRLIALVHSDDNALRVPPVGATPVLPNRDEQSRHAWEQIRKARGMESGDGGRPTNRAGEVPPAC
jgi:hypothetical protein